MQHVIETKFGVVVLGFEPGDENVVIWASLVPISKPWDFDPENLFRYACSDLQILLEYHYGTVKTLNGARTYKVFETKRIVQEQEDFVCAEFKSICERLFRPVM